MNEYNRINLNTYCFSLNVCSLLHNYGTCYINYAINENIKITTYPPYWLVTKKKFFHTRNCPFVQAHQLPCLISLH